VAVGINQDDSTGDTVDTERGSAKVYEYDGSSWVQLGNTIYGDDPEDYAGVSVSLSNDGSRVAVGFIDDDSIGDTVETMRGSVKVYEYNSSKNTWVQIGKTLYGDDPFDSAGRSVSLSGDGIRVAVGAYLDESMGEPDVTNRGSVKVYEYKTL